MAPCMTGAAWPRFTTYCQVPWQSDFCEAAKAWMWSVTWTMKLAGAMCRPGLVPGVQKLCLKLK